MPKAIPASPLHLEKSVEEEEEKSSASSLARLTPEKPISLLSESLEALKQLAIHPLAPTNGVLTLAISTSVSLENEEVKNHLLLATQGIELFCDLYKMGRFDLLAVCVHSYLLDCHVATERQLSLPKSTHSLFSAAEKFDFNTADKEFLKMHDQALLWTRYLAHFRGKANAPLPVQWLDTLMKKPTAQHARVVLEEVTESYKGLLHFFEIQNPMIEQVLTQVKQFSPPEAVIFPKYPKLINQIEGAARNAVHVRSIQGGRPC